MASGKTWAWLAGIVSVLCALTLSFAVGGAPSWTGDATVVVLVAAGVIILFPYVRGHRRPTRTRFAGGPEVSRDTATAHDSQVLSEIVDILTPKDIEWLRGETFDSQWRSARIVPFRALLDRARRANAFELYHSGIDAAVLTLLEAVAAFLALYEEATDTEHLTAGDIWREVRGAATVEHSPSEKAAFERRCARLRKRAADTVEAYDRLGTLGG